MSMPDVWSGGEQTLCSSQVPSRLSLLGTAHLLHGTRTCVFPLLLPCVWPPTSFSVSPDTASPEAPSWSREDLRWNPVLERDLRSKIQGGSEGGLTRAGRFRTASNAPPASTREGSFSLPLTTLQESISFRLHLRMASGS